MRIFNRMAENKQKGSKNKKIASMSNSKSLQAEKNSQKKFAREDADKRDVLLKVGPLEYKLPGKRQRLVIGSIVLWLNLLLVIAVIVYFYNPSFQEFVFRSIGLA